MLLPSVMLLVALLVQPGCVLYTRMVMRSAAAECARLLATAGTDDDDACKAFVLRRLGAVPEVAPFHVGGSADWEVTLERGEGAREVTVGIRGHLRPLPLLGVAARALGTAEGDLVLVEVGVTERVRPEWLRGSYGTWVKMWG